jgi:hypothetical protein
LETTALSIAKLKLADVLKAIRKVWPDLADQAINRISKADFASRFILFAQKYSPTRGNGAISVLR